MIDFYYFLVPKLVKLNWSFLFIDANNLKELEPRASGVYLDPEYTEKFQSTELDFLGIGPPSPKFYSRRAPVPKPPQPPLSPENG